MLWCCFWVLARSRTECRSRSVQWLPLRRRRRRRLRRHVCVRRVLWVAEDCFHCDGKLREEFIIKKNDLNRSSKKVHNCLKLHFPRIIWWVSMHFKWTINVLFVYDKLPFLRVFNSPLCNLFTVRAKYTPIQSPLYELSNDFVLFCPLRCVESMNERRPSTASTGIFVIAPCLLTQSPPFLKKDPTLSDRSGNSMSGTQSARTGLYRTDRTDPTQNTHQPVLRLCLLPQLYTQTDTNTHSRVRWFRFHFRATVRHSGSEAPYSHRFHHHSVWCEKSSAMV